MHATAAFLSFCRPLRFPDADCLCCLGLSVADGAPAGCGGLRSQAPLNHRVGAKLWVPGLLLSCVLCSAIIGPMFSLPLWQVCEALAFLLRYH